MGGQTFWRDFGHFLTDGEVYPVLENPGFVHHSIIRTGFSFGIWSVRRNSSSIARDFQNISDGERGKACGKKDFLPAMDFYGHGLAIVVKICVSIPSIKFLSQKLYCSSVKSKKIFYGPFFYVGGFT